MLSTMDILPQCKSCSQIVTDPCDPFLNEHCPHYFKLEEGKWYLFGCIGPAKLTRILAPGKPCVEAWTPWAGVSYPLKCAIEREATNEDLQRHEERMYNKVRYYASVYHEIVGFRRGGGIPNVKDS